MIVSLDGGWCGTSWVCTGIVSVGLLHCIELSGVTWLRDSWCVGGCWGDCSATWLGFWGEKRPSILERSCALFLSCEAWICAQTLCIDLDICEIWPLIAMLWAWSCCWKAFAWDCMQRLNSAVVRTSCSMKKIGWIWWRFCWILGFPGVLIPSLFLTWPWLIPVCSGVLWSGCQWT